MFLFEKCCFSLFCLALKLCDRNYVRLHAAVITREVDVECASKICTRNASLMRGNISQIRLNFAAAKQDYLRVDQVQFEKLALNLSGARTFNAAFQISVVHRRAGRISIL